MALDAGEEWVDTLCSLFLLELLPCTAMWAVSYILLQLSSVSVSSGTCTVTQTGLRAVVSPGNARGSGRGWFWS